MPFKKSAVKRTKSTDILSANEYNRKRTDVVEELKNKRINVAYRNTNRNYVTADSYSNDIMHVTLASPAVKGIPIRTALWHELSHVLHNSFATSFFNASHDLAKKQVDRILDKNPIFAEVDKALRSVRDPFTNAPDSLDKSQYVNQLMQLYRMGFNAIEDQRIESLTGSVWLGTGKMFNKMRDSLGERLLENLKSNVNSEDGMDNPINHLLLIRFNQAGAVRADHKLHKAMTDVAGKDEFGSIVIWKRYVKPVIDKWFTKRIEKQAEKYNESLSKNIEQLEQTKSKEEECEEKSTALEKISNFGQDYVYEKMNDYDKMLNRIGTEETKTIRDKENRYDKSERVYRKLNVHKYDKREELDELKREINSSRTSMLNEVHDMGKETTRDGVNTSVSKQTGMDRNQCDIGEDDEDALSERCKEEALDLDSEDIDEDNMDTMLAESEEGGIGQVKEIKNGLSGMAMPKEPSNIHIVSRVQKDNNVDSTLVTGLRTIVSKLKERNVPTLSDTGDEFDEDEYINLKQRGYGDVFKQNKLQNGIDILVSIDGSGSMESNENIVEARKLVSSLFKVAQTISELTVEANVWSSNTDGDVGMTTIRTLAECKNISTSVSGGRYYETPTHEAMAYSARRLKRMQGRHKMLILITDGYPQFSKGGVHMSNKAIVTACKKNLRKVLQVTDNVICINVEPRGYTTCEMLKDIFGKRYVEYEGVKKANEFVSKTLKRKFIEVLRR